MASLNETAKEKTHSWKRVQELEHRAASHSKELVGNGECYFRYNNWGELRVLWNNKSNDLPPLPD